MTWQVCTYDQWDRYTTEGYGWLSLGGICPGSSTQYVDTWKPLGAQSDSDLGVMPAAELCCKYVLASTLGLLLLEPCAATIRL